jgi:hypothetical protein
MCLLAVLLLVTAQAVAQTKYVVVFDSSYKQFIEINLSF